MDALRLYESWILGAPEMAVKVVYIKDTSGSSIELVGENNFEPIKDDDMVLPNKYSWNHSMFSWDIRTQPVIVPWVWYEKDGNDTETSFTLGVSGEIPKTGIEISASATVKLTGSDDPIYNQKVKWHDPAIKTYGNGNFYFEFTTVRL
jgi:hypothetical protein